MLKYWFCKSKILIGFLSTFIIFSIFVSLRVSPNKLSLGLLFFSLFVSMVSYLYCLSLFIVSVIIISFSSGMMILFVYCSMISSYEVKSNSFRVPFLVFFLSFFILSFFDSFYVSLLGSLDSVGLVFRGSYVLLFIIILVIFTMFCVNSLIFNPQKSLLISYFQWFFWN